MALDSENLIVSAPNISPTDLQTLFGDTNMTVYGACLSSQINEWSRYKPIYRAGITGVNFHFREEGYDSGYHGLVSKSYLTWSALGNALVQSGELVTITDWTYNKSLLKLSTAPKRLGDFDGYYHKAIPPFDGFHCPPILSNSNNTNQDAYLIFGLQTDIGADDPTAAGSIGISQIATPAALNFSTTTLDKLYFGVALINSSGTIVWAKSELSVTDSSGEPSSHTYEVAMALKDKGVPAGTYFAVPILTRNSISSVADDPGQICLVPNCSPVRITVTSSEAVNEDIDVTFTNCIYRPFADNDEEGIIYSTIRVESKASYDKKCTYSAYVELNGSSSQTSLEAGSFNLPSGGVYTITYMPATTLSEAEQMSISVTVKAKRADGVTEQSVTATRVPLVPILE